ncbi:hypothetical protein ACTMU2_14905 [Cupriavidus basilensis]
MGALFLRRDTQGVARRWLELTGKGNKPRLSAATDKLIAELAGYPSCAWAVAHPAVRAKLARCCCRSHWWA